MVPYRPRGEGHHQGSEGGQGNNLCQLCLPLLVLQLGCLQLLLHLRHHSDGTKQKRKERRGQSERMEWSGAEGKPFSCFKACKAPIFMPLLVKDLCPSLLAADLPQPIENVMRFDGRTWRGPPQSK